MAFTSWDPRFTPFITNPSTGATLGLQGKFPGGGRMVVTGPDNHYHGNRCSYGRYLNQYKLELNEVRWVAGFDNCIQDSTTRSNVVFRPATGDYFFTSCPDETVTAGHGMVNSSGCTTMIQDSTPGHFLVAASMTCNNLNMAKGMFFSPPRFITLYTSNTNAGACSCLTDYPVDAYCSAIKK